jgi:ribonuclease Z
MPSIEFLGNWSSNIESGKRNISIIIDRKTVLDFGPHSLESLLEMGIDPKNIETVLISHMHLDHFAGIPEILWYRAIHRCKENLSVIGPKGIRKVTESLLRSYHTPEAFEINVEYREEKGDFAQGFLSNHLIRDIGYRIELGNTVLYYSGDTSYTENSSKGADGSDILFHEMTYLDSDRSEADFWKHSTVSDALRVHSEARSKILVPVHLSSSTYAYIRNYSGKISSLRPPEGKITIP